MQVSGSVGGEIKVNEASCAEAAQGFSTSSDAIKATMDILNGMKGGLSNWKGDAANKGKDTIDAAIDTGDDLSSGVNNLGQLITSAQETFALNDDAAAAKMK